MSLLPAAQRKTEKVTVAGTELVLHELSAFERCEYLEKSTAHLPLSNDGGDAEIEIKTLAEFWAMRRATLSGQLLLVAYALKPGRSESVADLHLELCKSLLPDQVDALYEPAAKLSGLFTEADKAVGAEGSEGEEGGEKKE